MARGAWEEQAALELRIGERDVAVMESPGARPCANTKRTLRWHGGSFGVRESALDVGEGAQRERRREGQ